MKESFLSCWMCLCVFVCVLMGKKGGGGKRGEGGGFLNSSCFG